MIRPVSGIRGLATLTWLLATICIPPVLAQQAEETKSSPEALNLYRDAASFQNNMAYDLAAEEWQNFLTRFPNDPMASKARHYLGVCNLQLKRYEPAAAAFAEVIQKDPKFSQIEETYLHLGWSQYSQAQLGKKELYEPAARTFAQLATKFPQGKYRDQALFFQGESLYAVGKKQEALALYGQVVREHEKSSLRCDAVYALGVTQEELGKYEEAGQTYDLFLRDCGESSLVNEVRMRKAETILQAGQFAEAEKQFAAVAAIEGFASADHALVRQAYAASKQDKFAEAGDLYARVVESFPQSSYFQEAMLSAGRCYYRAEKLESAAQWFTKVVDAGKGDAPEAAHWLSRILLRDQKPQPALEILAKVLPNATESAFHVQLKMDEADAVYDIEGRRPEALDMYLKIATANPDHPLAPQALYNASFAALDLKRYAEALDLAGQFGQRYPQDRLLPDVHYVAAECHLQLGQFAESEKLYRELTAGDPQHQQMENWRVRLGMTLYLQKKYPETIEYFSGALGRLDRKENQAEAKFLVGASHFAENRFSEAADALRSSLLASPSWRQADETLLYLSRAQLKLNKLDEARKSIDLLLKSFPASGLSDQAHYRLGEIHYAANDYAASAAEYDVVIRSGKDALFVPFAYYGKGWALLKQANYAEGATAFSSLLKEFPQHELAAESHLARAMCLHRTGEHQAAIDDLTEYLKTNPPADQRCDALYERGLAEAALKQFDTAAKTFTGILSENEKYASRDKVLYELGWAYKSLEKDGDAAARFAELARSYPSSPLAAEAHYHVGEDEYSKGNFAEAIKAYEQAKQASPSDELDERADYKLGWSRFQLKQYDAALNHFTGQTKEHPQGALLADGLYMTAESLFRLNRFQDALPAFEAAQKVPASSPQIEVLIHLHGGQSASQLERWEDSLKWLAAIPEKFADSPYLAEALYEQGWAQQKLGKVGDATQSYTQAAAKSRGAVGARARFMLGELAFSAKKLDEAIREFQRVMFGFGGDAAPADVKTWQAKAGYEAARCSEVQIRDAQDPQTRAGLIADAKRFYGYVVSKHPESDLVAEAKKRLEALGKL